jgi:subtilisin family serine protease
VRLAASLAVAVAALGAGAGQAAAASDAPDAPDAAPSAQPQFVPGEVLVRYRDGTSGSERAQVRSEQDATLAQKLPLKNTELLKLAPGDSVSQTVNDLEDQADLVYAQPNFIRHSDSVIPNDPSFGQLWGLDNQGQAINGVSGTPDADIDAPEAWDKTTGSSNVTVGVVDTGMDTSRPDLAPNAWTNPGETGLDSNGHDKRSNGLDDDGDGKIDDWQGWDFVFGDNVPNDANGHGTHVAGTIGARGNDGVGVAGVTWNSKIMPVRVLNSAGSGSDANIAAGFRFAARHGAQVVNASLGGPGTSQVLTDAVTQSPNTLFVVAAGNDAANNDTTDEEPCDIPAPNLVCVAATTQTDGLASFSNFGVLNVDLGAPGRRILSTCPPGASGFSCSSGFAYLSGTSMATPHVAGVAALVNADQPGASALQVKQALLDSVDYLPSLDGKTVTGGRVNAARALGLLPPSIKSSPSGGGSPPAPAPAPAGGSASPPSADPVTQIGFTLAKKVTNHSNGDAVLVVNVPGAGLVWAKATARLPSYKASSGATKEVRITTLTVPVTKAGSVKLRISPTGAAKIVLKKRGKLKARVTVSYRPSKGSVQSQTRTITLRYKKKR